MTRITTLGDLRTVVAQECALRYPGAAVTVDEVPVIGGRSYRPEIPDARCVWLTLGPARVLVVLPQEGAYVAESVRHLVELAQCGDRRG